MQKNPRRELMDFDDLDDIEKFALIFFGGAAIFGLCVVAYLIWKFGGI